MGHKTAETTHASTTMRLTQKLLMNVQCSDDSRSFAKTRASKMKNIVASHQKLTSTN